MRLVRDLTRRYQLDGQSVLLMEPVNLNEVCEDAAHEIMPFAVMQGQDIQLDFAGRAQLVIADRELLHSILFNLLDNAVRHTPPEATIRMQLRRRTEMVRVCVHDDGPGLLPSDMAHLTQRLGKQTRPIVTRSSGSGLGLYIAQQFADAMGGRIGVGRVRSGADFHVDLLHSRQLRFL